MNHTVNLHLTEKYTTNDGSPIFEGWMTGSKSEMFGGLRHTHCAMTSQQAIAYKCEVERKPLPSDDPCRRCPDISAAKAHLGWHPTTPLWQGLRNTVNYFKAELVK